MTRGTPPRRTPPGRATATGRGSTGRTPAASKRDPNKPRSFNLGLRKPNGAFNWNRLVVYILGIVILIALSFPFWRGIAFPDPVDVAFGALPPEQRAILRTLPEDQAALLEEMVKTDAAKASDMITAIKKAPIHWEEGLPPADNRVFADGPFTGMDAIRVAQGKVTIYRAGELTYLRLENFFVTNGPALHLYISSQSNVTPETLDMNAAYDIGELKGTQGLVLYRLNFSASGYKTVFIYDTKYNELYAVAPLTFH